MNLLQDIITYIRRIIKTATDAEITDNLIIDYINRFWMMDVDARIQLFDLKVKYQFQTVPGVDRYNMPLYDVQIEGKQNVGMYPVYQGFLQPAYVNGVQIPLQTQRNLYFNVYPDVIQNMQVVGVGDGTNGPYTLNFPILPNTTPPINPPVTAILRGHVDISGIISTGVNIDPPLGSTLNLEVPVTSVDSSVFITSTDETGANVVVQDSGQFLDTDINCGLLMIPGKAPFGNQPMLGGYSKTLNTVNYFTGTTQVIFPVPIPAGMNINAQCLYFNSGLPRMLLYYNNVITLRAPPSQQYLVELDAYLSPSAFLNTASAIPFGYMAEYIARGAARKILSDTGDIEQFQFYEMLFKEQEMLVWKRSQRQFTSTRSETLYSQGFSQGTSNSFGGGTV